MSGSMGGSLAVAHGSGSSGGSGGSSKTMKEEQALVASVLNAVCEKMVGVVSDKTKGYLSKASRRTERKVLERMARLEERIQSFDRVLEGATSGMTEVEKSLHSMEAAPVVSSS